jgi:hypothetical protein
MFRGGRGGMPAFARGGGRGRAFFDVYEDEDEDDDDDEEDEDGLPTHQHQHHHHHHHEHHHEQEPDDHTPAGHRKLPKSGHNGHCTCHLRPDENAGLYYSNEKRAERANKRGKGGKNRASQPHQESNVAPTMAPELMDPLIVQSVAISSVVLEWEVPMWPVKQFNVQMREERSFGGFQDWKHAASCANLGLDGQPQFQAGQMMELNIPGLKRNTKYQFSIRSENSVGRGEYSAVSVAKTLPDPQAASKKAAKATSSNNNTTSSSSGTSSSSSSSSSSRINTTTTTTTSTTTTTTTPTTSNRDDSSVDGSRDGGGVGVPVQDDAWAKEALEATGMTFQESQRLKQQQKQQQIKQAKQQAKQKKVNKKGKAGKAAGGNGYESNASDGSSIGGGRGGSGGGSTGAGVSGFGVGSPDDVASGAESGAQVAMGKKEILEARLRDDEEARREQER